MLTRGDYSLLYNITENVTPLNSDCGILCNSICCRADGNNSMGIYLFPGEETMLNGTEEWIRWEKCDRDEHFFPPSWPDTVFFVKCISPCKRKLRPLACRFFPLTPHITKDNRLVLIYETLDLPYSCPLIKNKITLQEEFIKVAAWCWKYMLKDYRIEDLITEDSLERELENQKKIEIIWP